jgi:hypothetical protein
VKLFVRLLSLVFLAAVIVSAFGFFSDNRPVEAKAQALACEGRGPTCSARLTRLARTPLWQDLQFRVSKETVEIRCVRRAYILGEYTCAQR